MHPDRFVAASGKAAAPARNNATLSFGNSGAVSTMIGIRCVSRMIRSISIPLIPGS